MSFGILIVCLLIDLYCDDFVDYSYSIRQLLGVSTVNSDRLEKVQTEAARIVTGLTSYASLDSIYCETGLGKITVRREVKKLNLFYKITNIKSFC
jgi:hypothetical protein